MLNIAIHKTTCSVRSPLTSEQTKLLSNILELQYISNSDSITLEIAQQMKNLMTQKIEELIISKYLENKSRTTQNGIRQQKDGRWYSYNPRFIARTYDSLLEKLFEYYFAPEPPAPTLADLFPKWIIKRRERGKKSPKTLEENVGLWKRKLEGLNITNTPVDKITPSDLMDTFDAWVGNALITYKEFSSRKTILQGLFRQAILDGIITTNPLKDLPINELNFKKSPAKKMAYTEEERSRILEHIANVNEIYTLAIQLDFLGVMRIGELKALRWTPEQENVITIEQQLVPERFMNDDLTFDRRKYVAKEPKGNAAFSIRQQTLPPQAISILKRARRLNPDGKYVFMVDGRPMTTDTYNRRLRSICEELGITYLSSHKIRFTSASMCLHGGMNAVQIQPLLGHTTKNMTDHYLRPVTTSAQDGKQMSQILA